MIPARGDGITSKRLRGLVQLALVCLCAGSAAATGAEPTKPRPNVLFIAIDDLRPSFGAYGESQVRTPQLDQLARRGVVFDRAYCQYPLCAPSRASVLTGARPDSTGVRDLYTNFRTLLGDAPSLPGLFKQHGYYTDRFGKVFHVDDVESWTPVRPPEKFGPGDPAKRAPYANARINEEGWRKFDLAKARGVTGMELERSQRGPSVEIADVPDDALPDGRIAGEAVAALRQRAREGKPFFLAVGFNKPHLPFSAPRKYWDLYDREKIDLAREPRLPRNAEVVLGSGVELYTYTDVPSERPLPADYARLARHGYYACVSFVDAQVGRVLDELDALGLAGSTIVVVWSDHGYKLGEHGGWAKEAVFELDARVPLIVRGHARPAGARTGGLVELVDLYPTLAELAGLPMPPHVEGDSFAALLKEPARSWKPAAFTQFNRGEWQGRSIRTDRHRLARWVNPRGDEIVQLFDHSRDPGERTDLAGAVETAEIQRQLLAQLAAGWQRFQP